MPTLADIYSAIDSAKRRASDFIQNPGTSLDQMLGYANDRARNYNQQMVQAAQGFGAPARGQQATPEQLAAQQSTMQTMAEAYNPAGMTVFHGSPHVFERFDISKLGTGEGNQSYGRGLYMAQNPKVAEAYRDQLSPIDLTQKSNSQLDEWSHWATSSADDKNHAFEMIDNLVNTSKNNTPIPNGFKSWNDFADQVKSETQKRYSGQLYKVDLPDTHIRRMLDWDAPLKDQPKPVRDLAKSLGMDLNDLGGDLLAKVGKGEAGKQILQNAGIPGVKYFDQVSRNANAGTRNFVVFDDKHLKILERNDQPIK
jgi:hypothetical protein